MTTHPQTAAPKRALVLGATGLIGTQLTRQLLDDPRYAEVRVLTRRTLDLQHPKLRQIVASLDALEAQAEHFQVEQVFVCLGTTIKQAGSQAAFRRVDFDYVLTAAQLGARAGVEHFGWVSSVGATARTGNFYLRTKGELEDAIATLPLAHWSAVRPSLLLGDRGEFRFGERAATLLSKPLSALLIGGLRRYRPIEAAKVAASMRALAWGEAAEPGLETLSGGLTTTL